MFGNEVGLKTRY